MTADAEIVVGVRGDLSGGKQVKRNLDDIKASGKGAKSSVDSVTKSLQFQIDQLKRNDVQQAIHNNLRKAGVTLNSATGQNIAALTQQYHANSQELERQSAKTKAYNDRVQNLQRTLLTLATAYLGIRTAVHQFNEAIGAGIELQALTNKMNAAVKSADVARQSFKFLKDISQQLGLDFASTSEGFADFSAAALRAGLTFGDVKTIFKDVATAAVSMQLPAEQVHGIFVALEQMASKGNVQMQELKLQLGNNLPGAFEIFAKSMGVSTSEFNKMISNGQIGVDKLKGFAEELKKELGSQVAVASQQAVAETNRLRTATFKLRSEFSNSGALDGYTELIRSLTRLFNDKGFQDSIKNVGDLTGRFLTRISIGVYNFEKFNNFMKDYVDNAKALANIGSQYSTVTFNKNYGVTPGAATWQNAKADQKAVNSGAKNLTDVLKGQGWNLDNTYTLGQGKTGLTHAQQMAADKIKKVVEQLKLETANLSRTNAQQNLYNNLKKAGVTLDSEAGQKIAALTEAYNEQARVIDKQTQITGGLSTATDNFFKTATSGAHGWSDGLKGLLKDLDNLAYQMLVIEPIKEKLFGSSGTGAGGILSGIISGAASALVGGSSSSNTGAAALKAAGGPSQIGVKPKFASGGSMIIGGNPGIDQNTLSLNGVPIADVSHGETLSISPTQKTSGGVVINQYFNISTGVQQTVRAELQSMLPEIQRSTIAAVHDAKMRGLN